MDDPTRRGGHRVKSDKCSRRHYDFAAMRPCQLDKIFIVEQSAGAENDRRLPVHQDRFYGHAELPAGRALHDYVRGFPKSLDRQNQWMNAQAVQKLTMFARLANGDRGKNHPRDTPIEFPCDP
jgi:hypothetical protein